MAITPESYRRLREERGTGGRLTARQRAVLAYYYKFAESHGRWPTIREAMDSIGVSSPNSIVGFLNALEKRGYISASRKRYGQRVLAGARLVPQIEDTPEGVRLAEALAGVEG